MSLIEITMINTDHAHQLSSAEYGLATNGLPMLYATKNVPNNWNKIKSMF